MKTIFESFKRDTSLQKSKEWEQKQQASSLKLGGKKVDRKTNPAVAAKQRSKLEVARKCGSGQKITRNSPEPKKNEKRAGDETKPSLKVFIEAADNGCHAVPSRKQEGQETTLFLKMLPTVQSRSPMLRH